jgi:hypothetical protein
MEIYIDIRVVEHKLPHEVRTMLFDRCSQVIFPEPDVYRYKFNNTEIRDIAAAELEAKDIEFKKSGK